MAIAKKDINNCLNILNKYPLLTSRKICQLEHFKKCMAASLYTYHLDNRDYKYIHRR
jgi:hypothetical protein